MHLRTVSLKNIKSFESINWEVASEDAAGWHVILGDNGSGKSTFLRAIALALIGTTEAIALRQNWNDWLRRDAIVGYIRLNIDEPKGPVIIGLSRDENDQDKVFISPGFAGSDPILQGQIWRGKTELFSASYGPFRRFTGGDKDYEKLYEINPRVAPHLSLFGESVALSEALRWLQDLKFKKLEGNPEGNLLDAVIAFINQAGFLPHQAYLKDVTSSGVRFVDGNGCELPVEELSDGYRSILSMTFELIRQMAANYGASHLFDPDDPTKITRSGVVLIDEPDAHLHPTWQRRIGLWFREHFPRIQFIVTTHSPLICQAASVGSVWRLPDPGEDTAAYQVKGEELNRLLYGNVLDAYNTELFGENISRSEASKQRLQRLAELNLKEMRQALTQAESNEQRVLRNALPTTAHTISGEE